MNKDVLRPICLAVALSGLACAGIPALAAGAPRPPKGAVAPDTAVQLMAATTPDLLAGSPNADIAGKAVQPRVTDAGDEILATGTLVDTSIGKMPGDGFAIDTPDGPLSFEPVLASDGAGEPALVDDTAVVIANAWPSTDAAIRPTALGATTALSIRDETAPGSYTWRVGIGPDQSLEQLADGSIAITDATLADTTTPLSAFEPFTDPWLGD